jgi:twitching motility protein PilT
MRKLNPDPDLDRLVQELNQHGEEASEASEEHALPTAAAPHALDPPRLREVGEGDSLEALLTEMTRRQASDLHLVPGAPPAIRVDGRLTLLAAPPLDPELVWQTFLPHLGPRAHAQLAEQGATDLTLRLGPGSTAVARGYRFRVNLHRQRGRVAAAVRALPTRIPTLEELHLPPTLADLVTPSRGLVLVCGPTGSGKSSTLAALVDVINRGRAAHVITVEDPLEYEHVNQRAVVEHVEIGSDAPSFAAALRAALRQDPDVLLVGEMRDLETIATAVTAAETGHLVLATLHTHDVAQAMHRIVDVFPSAQQGQIRQQLALSLHAVIAQQLVPRRDRPGRVPALEVLLASYAVRSHIRSGQLHRVHQEVTLGKRHGMVSLEESLARLVRGGTIEVDEARVRATRPDELESLLRG